MGKEGERRKSLQFSSVQSSRSKQVWLPNLGVWAMLPSAMSNNSNCKKDDDISLDKEPRASCSRTEGINFGSTSSIPLQEEATEVDDDSRIRRNIYNFPSSGNSNVGLVSSTHRHTECFNSSSREFCDFHSVSVPESSCRQQQFSTFAAENCNSSQVLDSPSSVPSSSFLINQNSSTEDVTETCIENVVGFEQPPDATVEKVTPCTLPQVDDPDRNDSGPCPICLTAIAPESKAILKFCLHTFCVGCILRWSSIRRFCPLCKGDFVGWWYNIQDDTRYKEQDLPSLCQETGGQGGQRTLERASEWPLTTRGQWRFERFEWRPRRVPRPQQSRRPEQPSSGPRPYFYRLQRGLRSTDDRVPEQDWSSLRSDRQNTPTAFAGTGSSSGRFRDGNQHSHRGFAQSFERRRCVYEQNLRSLPVESTRLHRGGQVLARGDVEGEARVRQRLEPWIQRELKVLLGESNHSIIIHVIFGLWFAFSGQSDSLRQGTHTQNQPFLLRNIRGVEGVTESRAISELDKFLGSNASIFWHEFRNFAENPFTMQAYDSVVRYVPCNELPSSDFPANQESVSLQNNNRSDVNSSLNIQSSSHIRTSPNIQPCPPIQSSPCIRSPSRIRLSPHTLSSSHIQSSSGRETRNDMNGELERQGSTSRSRKGKINIIESNEGKPVRTEFTRIGETGIKTEPISEKRNDGKRPWQRNLRMDDEVVRGEREQTRDTENEESETGTGKRRFLKRNMRVWKSLESEIRNGINGETEQQGNTDRSRERDTRIVEFYEVKQSLTQDTRIGGTETRTERLTENKNEEKRQRDRNSRTGNEVGRDESEQIRDARNGDSRLGTGKRMFLERNMRLYKSLRDEHSPV